VCGKRMLATYGGRCFSDYAAATQSCLQVAPADFVGVMRVLYTNSQLKHFATKYIE